MSTNITVLSGNLTRDVELKQVGSGHVANFSIAVNRRFKNAKDEWQEETSYVDCEAWGPRAENIARLLKKGSSVLINGSLKQDRWETDGQKRSKLLVRVENFEVLDRKQNAAADDSERAAATASANASSGDATGNMDDDIPF